MAALSDPRDSLRSSRGLLSLFCFGQQLARRAGPAPVAKAPGQVGVVMVFQRLVEEVDCFLFEAVVEQVLGQQALVLQRRQLLLQLAASLQSVARFSPCLVRLNERAPGAVMRPAAVALDQLF